jgi:hypothetical protein
MAQHHTRQAMDTNPEQELASDLGMEGFVLGLLVCSSVESFLLPVPILLLILSLLYGC